MMNLDSRLTRRAHFRDMNELIEAHVDSAVVDHSSGLRNGSSRVRVETHVRDETSDKVTEDSVALWVPVRR